MRIICQEAGPLATNCYIVYSDATKSAVLIDTPPDSTSLFKKKADELGINLKAVLLTHTHWDHSGDAALVSRIFDIPVYVHNDDEYRMIHPHENALMELPFELEPCKADNYLIDGEELIFDDIKVNVIHTPGHTEGGVCFLINDGKDLISGDTLFNRNVGRFDLPGGSEEILVKSIKEKLFKLNPECRVYPGHGPATTIGDEIKFNYFINQFHSI